MTTSSCAMCKERPATPQGRYCTICVSAARSQSAKQRWREGRGPKRISAAVLKPKPPRVYKFSEATREKMRAAMLRRMETGPNPAVGRPKSAEWKRKFAERLRAGLVGFKTAKASIYTRADGRTVAVRSGWEYSVAAHLDRSGVAWEYEDRTLTLGDEVMVPDFTVWPGPRFIEVKGYLSPAAKEKLGRFCSAYPVEIWDKAKLTDLGLWTSGPSRRAASTT